MDTATKNNEKYEDLFERFDANRLRTVSNFREMMPGCYDVRVEIELEDKTCKFLSFPVPWDGFFYAYYRTDSKGSKDKWFINDWGDGRCQLMQEVEGKQVYKAFVKTDDVLRLLEGCIRIPAQRVGYVKEESDV